MLSRVANRIYWLGRYMERAENSARLINVNSTLLFDLPRGSKVRWDTLLEIVDSEQAYKDNHDDNSEASVIEFMIADISNPASIVNSVKNARENARTTREILPSEAWECVNRLYLYIKDCAITSLGRKERYSFLQVVIENSQQLAGMLNGTMSHNHAYEFMQLGNNIERADMTSRLIDLGVTINVPNLLDNPEEHATTDPYETLLWMNILTSLSAYQSYRQQIQNRVNGEKVVQFLLNDPEFPRTILYCMNEVLRSLIKLPNAGDSTMMIEALLVQIENADIDLSASEQLHQFVDELQIKFNQLNKEIENKWFLY